MSLGQNIYTLRKEKGLSQEKLAEHIGVARQTISNWELGETSPNPEQLILLSKALNKSIDELVENDHEQPVCNDTHSRRKNRNTLCAALAVLIGCAAGVWSFSANRFRWDEIVWIVGIGMLAGICLGVICHCVLQYKTDHTSDSKGDTR